MAKVSHKTKKRHVIPGFGLSLGYCISFMSIIVLLPLIGLFIYGSQLPFAEWVKLLTGRQFCSALTLSLITALSSAVINSFIGLLFAWVLVRYQFFGKKIIDTFIDTPFALPTAVAGIALTAIYSPKGLIGELFSFKIAYTPIGITLALIFITLPFVVRTLQPVIEELPKEAEDAARVLGASNWQIFYRIIFPALIPAWLTGSTLAFARALGEYGSVVFIAGNIPFKTEILPLLIVSKLSQYKYEAAAAIGIVMLLMSFVLLLIINSIQHRITSKTK